ncbi:pyridoxal phosphate-dependent decarboxylase family protein [Agrococcus sp. SGAir0287]|uniref:pyridoxal phosphate-dependent decarboxylase family protein n=1 Tax=Agrococcus sp. SGAir0287 TaxID=2070347 RepID=UPI0010CD3FAB|nr:aminotransferase class V-fold PLP-dependent enzyme [Agrococcus sp. SGAir0287]QCR18863.1 aspartate aminotransferase family protein [Agrococcus sp. SGAir0287]
MTFAIEPDEVLARLRSLRAERDAPTRGGRVLSYVYDPGVPELHHLVEEAALEVLHLNGLDPFVYGSLAVVERELGAMMKRLLHGDEGVVATCTSGGTESIILAVLAAREAHPGRRRIVAPTTRHPAFQKAAHLLGMTLEVVPVTPDGVVDVDAFVAALDDDVALAVVSAPSYPHGVVDPIEAVAAACAERGIDVHVDACFGGMVLPFLDDVPPWDLAVPGVTSISADLHKYGYGPKGASVLLQRGADRQRGMMFADADWPGYPVATSTLLGSRQAAGLVAAWAVLQSLGTEGFGVLQARCRRIADAIRSTVEGIEGLRVVGDPVGVALAIATDAASASPVDPLRLGDALVARGFLAQAQPGLRQHGQPDLPSTLHLTVTPALDQHLDALREALVACAEEVRGVPAATGEAAAPLAALEGVPIDSATAGAILAQVGAEDLGAERAELIAVIEATPPSVVHRLLVELLARELGD